MRITKVTTKIGDNGTTLLGDGTSISKSDLRICSLGDVDELNSFIGFAKTCTSNIDTQISLSKIQNNLLNLGGELSIPDNELNLLKEDSCEELEKKIEELIKNLPQLKDFILPGGDEFSARLHIARSICRRAERSIVKLMVAEKGRKIWIKYLNRLSDYLFVLARFHVTENNIDENQWSKT